MEAEEWPSDLVLCVSEVKIPTFEIGRDHPGACISYELGQAEIIGSHAFSSSVEARMVLRGAGSAGMAKESLTM